MIVILVLLCGLLLTGCGLPGNDGSQQVIVEGGSDQELRLERLPHEDGLIVAIDEEELVLENAAGDRTRFSYKNVYWESNMPMVEHLSAHQQSKFPTRVHYEPGGDQSQVKQARLILDVPA